MTGATLRPIALAVLVLLAGCDRTPATPPETPPDWRRFTIDGMAPMMTPEQIERALTVHGYRLRECAGEPIVADALRRSTDFVCMEAPAKRLTGSLRLLQLPEGRRLSRLRLTETVPDRSDTAGIRADYLSFLQTLVARWGPADRTIGEEPRMRAWIVPGASPTLPDNVITAESEGEGRNIEMTSFWAVEHEVKPDPAPAARP